MNCLTVDMNIDRSNQLRMLKLVLLSCLGFCGRERQVRTVNRQFVLQFNWKQICVNV